MKSFTLSHKKSRTVGLGVATLALSVGLFVMVERADAACTPATSPGTVINGQTVDCTGPTPDRTIRMAGAPAPKAA